MSVMRLVQGPLDHFYHWAMQQRTPDRVGNMAELVYSRCQTFTVELDALFDGAKWAYILECAPMSSLDRFAELIVGLLVMVNVDWHRRIVARVETFPPQLLWLSYAAPHVQCPHRKRLATKMISCKEDDLEPTTLKVRILFEEDLIAASHDGRLDPHVHFHFK